MSDKNLVRYVTIIAVVGCVYLLPLARLEGAQQNVDGVVVDAEFGIPVGGATLKVTAPGAAGTAPSGVLASTTSRPDGTFELPITDRMGVLAVAAPGYAIKRVRWPPDDLGLVTIRLERGARLIVRVSNDAGSPVPATLLIHTMHPGNPETRSAHTLTGDLEITGASSGQTIIVARAEGLAPTAASVEVAAGGTYGPLDIVLRTAASLDGVVRDASGNPRSGVAIVAGYGPGVAFGTTLANFLGRGLRTDQEGRFMIRNIVGNVPLQLFAEYQGRSFSAEPMTLNPGEHRSDVILVVD